MAKLRFESPLVWPEWQKATPRANQRNDHGLTASVTLTDSINYLDQELEALGASGTLYLDIEQPMIERLRKKIGSRSGACLQMRLQEKSYILACDRWQLPEHNIYALHLAIRQWRTIERWGVGEMDVLMRGFSTNIAAASGEQGASLPEWMLELGLGPTATLDDTIAVYHRRAKAIAQDTDALTRLNALIEQARKHFSGASA